MSQLFRSFILMLLALIPTIAVGQEQLPVKTVVLEDYFRRQQLIGKFDSTVTFLIRPISLQTNSFSKTIGKDRKHFKLGLLPIISKSKNNSKQPYGWNDGTFLPLRGYQQLISAGIVGKIGPLVFQLNPEYHYAANIEYKGFPLEAGNILWSRYYRSQLNFIDTPESFGAGTIEKFHLGQSSIKIEVGPISLGWSNQNIWWGPGLRNSLVMSNTAQGFQHLTVNTNRAIKTPLGFFEGQIIGGRLEASGFDPPNSNLFVNGNFVFTPRNEDWRYISGIALTYQPKWIPNLSLGFSRVVQQYNETARVNNDYFGAFSNLFRKNDNFDDIVRDQLASLFIRYFWTNTKSELYFEYARNDAAFNFRDFFLEPNHAAGYLFGFRKLLPFQQKKDEFIELQFEWTILAQSASRIIRNASTFYIHSRIRHGYTHKGEVLGAGSGPSSNVQTLNVSWVSGIKKLGISLERYTHNEDLYIDLFSDIRDFLRPWVDLSAAINASWDFDHLILNGHLRYIKSFNYQYQIYRSLGFFPAHVDVNNYSIGLDIVYRF